MFLEQCTTREETLTDRNFYKLQKHKIFGINYQESAKMGTSRKLTFKN